MLNSVFAFAMACAARAARTTLAHWPDQLQRLKVSAQENLPWARWLQGVYSKSFWDSEPIAVSLYSAYSQTTAVPNNIDDLRPQKKILAHLMSTHFPPNWSSI